MNIYDTQELTISRPNKADFNFPDPNHENVIFSFGNGSSVPLVLDKDGFRYKDKRIEDAGEAYELFKSWLRSQY